MLDSCNHNVSYEIHELIYNINIARFNRNNSEEKVPASDPAELTSGRKNTGKALKVVFYYEATSRDVINSGRKGHKRDR